MSHIKSFTILLALTFAFPWLVLVLMPHLSFRELHAVPYSEDELEFADGNVYPPGGAGRVANGHEIYTSEGCAYCHTQMVRPTLVLGTDMWREGWAGRGPKWQGDEGKPTPTRMLRPEDYMEESYAHLGIQRIGPDLSNVGWRITDEELVHRSLYSPRSVNSRSNMPGYESLYRVQRIGSGPAAKALKLEGEFSPEDGFEVVPTPRADALVSYLMSLKKDHLVPKELSGSNAATTTASAAPAAADGAPPKS
jgi:cytochrome c oxidase cbb3-type subunit 2